jgi:transposase-like protein
MKGYSRKFQRMAVERMQTCDDVEALAQELGVTRRCLYKWRRKLEAVEPAEESSRPATRAAFHRRENEQLKRLQAEKTLEVDFFRGALQKVEARRQSRGDSGAMASTSRSGK